MSLMEAATEGILSEISLLVLGEERKVAFSSQVAGETLPLVEGLQYLGVLLWGRRSFTFQLSARLTRTSTFQTLSCGHEVWVKTKMTRD